MADVMQYREVRQRFSVRDDDGPDSDLFPDRYTVTGVVEFTPKLPKGDVIAYPEEFVKPLPVTGRIIAGELFANWVVSDQEGPRPLFLPVTVDDNADQTWSWVMRVASLSIDGQEADIKMGDREFQVEAGDGPLWLSTVAAVSKGGTITTRGPRGYGITDITAEGGVVTVEWEGGEDVALPIPSAEYVANAVDGAKWARGELTAGMDLNSLPREGHYFARSFSSTANVLNWPPQAEGTPGHLEELRTSSGLNIQRVTTYGTNMKIIQRTVLSATNQTWSAWHVVWARDGSHLPPTPEPVDVPVDAYVQNQVRQTQFMQAMGGPIDTRGRSAVAFRMDHGFKNFAEKLLPLFRARGIVPSMVYNPRSWSRPENEGVTAADLNAWVQAGEVEVWNHGATHSNVHTEAELYDEIVNSLHEIEAELPAAAGKVWGFAPPGVGAGGYGGFGSGASPEDWDTVAGRLILKHHAVAAAYLYGTGTRPLDGTPRVGLSHYTMDKATVESLKGRVDTGIVRGHGVQFMVHPSLVDTEGYITTAQIEELLDYVVARRDQDQLLTLSPYQLLVADSTQGGATEVYESGVRDVTGLIPNVVSGTLHVWRSGSTVWMRFYRLLVTDPETNTYHSFMDLLPIGMRPGAQEYLPLAEAASASTRGPASPAASGHVYVYNATPGKRMDGLVSFHTPDDPPAQSALPGVPA